VRPTLHLVADDQWAASDEGQPYRHPSLETEGFIHCTDGDAEMARTANRHYAGDERAFVVLTVDLDRVEAPWRYDDRGSPYPHVYGPIERSAIVEVRPMPRSADGTFLPPGT
jgi:uncharacterized protein (DUF952 family)